MYICLSWVIIPINRIIAFVVNYMNRGIPQNVKNETEYLRQQEDLKNYPRNEYTGTYKGIKWIMKRPYNTYWCGYVHTPEDRVITKKEHKTLDGLAHGGLTGGPLGFDCSHYTDYHYKSEIGYEFTHQNATYKDYNYVYKTICRMIDFIVDADTKED